MTLNEIADVTKIISLLLLVISIFYTGKQLKLLRLIHADTHDWNRRKSAQDLTMELNILLSEIIESLQQDLNITNRIEPIPLDEINIAIKKDPTVRIKLSKLLNTYNSVARGIFAGVYDREIITRSRRKAMIKTFDSFSSYISYRRSDTWETLWNDYEWLVNQWKHDFTEQKPRIITGLVETK